jgi:short-subunit dehydrogenase
MPRNLTDKVIVITGASSGIGAATAIACAEAGMDVALGARRTEKLRDVAQQIEQRGRAALSVTCDVTDPAQVESLLDETWQRFGRVDAVFANAGYGVFGPVLETSDADHRAIFEANYFGTLTTLKAAAPYLRKTEGGLKHVLICSSAGSEIGLPLSGAYTATKAAQDCIAGAMRAEVAGEGMSVTSVHPVGTKTEFFDTAGARSSPGQGAGQAPTTTNTPPGMMQSVEHVARRIVGALRRPKPEVWPMPLARWGLALGTAVPRFAAAMMRRHYRRITRR